MGSPNDSRSGPGLRKARLERVTNTENDRSFRLVWDASALRARYVPRCLTTGEEPAPGYPPESIPQPSF